MDQNSDALIYQKGNRKMTNQVTTLEGEKMVQEKKNPADHIKVIMASRKKDFEGALPSHISFEKFQRTVLTACFQNPDLFATDKQSLMLSAIKCATDGLLPDGREAAFVIFNSKIKDENGDRWVKKAQYIPMWNGILKKIRQSQEIESVRAHVVYQIEVDRKLFTYVLGDDERIEHTPYLGNEEKGGIAAAYCIAKLKSGDIIREVMTFEEIEKVRRTSKSGHDSKTGNAIGIWRDWYEEMARKTVFRRASKWLPQCADIVDNILSSDASMDSFDDLPDPEIMDHNPNNIIDQTASDVSESEQENEPVMIENNPDAVIDTGNVVERVKEKVEGKKTTKDETYVPPMDDEELFQRSK